MHEGGLMRRRGAVMCLILGLGLVSTSCEPTTAVAIPVLVITATWDVQGQEGRRFSFSAEQDDSQGLESGTFTGTEFTVDPFDTHDFTGSWANGQLQMVVDRPGGNVTYTATFDYDRPDRLTLHSSQETIVIVQPQS
jgi:hypothetical protein